jgi:Chlorophyllase enzyme
MAMRGYEPSRSLFISGLAGLGLLVAYAGCSGSPQSGGSGSRATGSTSGSGGSSSGNGAADGTGGAGTGGAGSAATGSGGSGDDSGSSSGTGPVTSGTPDGGGAIADGGDSGPPGADCQPGDTIACSSFTTPTGTTIKLGPYGAQMDENVGKGFENTVQSGDMPGNESTCQGFVNLFGEDPNLGTKLLQTTNNGITIDFSLYSVYRPATWPGGALPVLTWGNGTCAQPEGYGALLRYVASYGYVVIAANSRWVGSGTPAPMLHALDFAAAANMDSTSPYYQNLDMTKIGAMGHSQGGSATVTAASDSRVKNAIIFNAADSGVAKPYLTLSGDMDITGFTASGMASAVNGASVPAAYLYYHNPAGMGSLRGHLVLMLSPERVNAPAVAWWQMMFRGDSASHAMFVGPSCGLCTDSSDYAYGANSLLK